MTLIASIITFSKKKKLEKKMLPSTLDMEPSTLDPRQKDRLFIESLPHVNASSLSPPRSKYQLNWTNDIGNIDCLCKWPKYYFTTFLQRIKQTIALEVADSTLAEVVYLNS